MIPKKRDYYISIIYENIRKINKRLGNNVYD